MEDCCKIRKSVLAGATIVAVAAVAMQTSLFAQAEPERFWLAGRYDLGDKYDLILNENRIATVTLSMLVGCETDEAVRNDSFVGALASLNES